jgi:multiple sugar transport system substrate-binding protein
MRICTKTPFLFISLLLLLVVTAGCSPNEKPSQEDKVLRIAVDSKGYYDYAYRDYVEAAFPGLKVELIELEEDNKPRSSIQEFMKNIEKEKPDLILTYPYRYMQLADNGLVSDLSVRFGESGMTEDDFYPGMIDWVKQASGGRLSGIAPFFQSSVLYYNETLFKKYGIELPHDGMSLEEVIELASRFTSRGGSKDGIVGMHQPRSNLPYNVLSQFAMSEGIRDVTFSRGKVSMDTPLWRHIIETVINLYESETLSMKEVKGKMINGILTFDKEATEQADLFKQGKAAMTIGYYGSSYNTEKFKTGYVEPPVSSKDRLSSSHIYVFDIMAIGAEAKNADTAWDVIRFMTSDHMAKIQSKLSTDTASSGFPTRKSYLNYVQDPIIGRIFQLKPIIFTAEPAIETDYDGRKFYLLFEELVNKEMDAAIKGEKSVDEIIKTIQKEGQALLDAAKKTK